MHTHNPFLKPAILQIDLNTMYVCIASLQGRARWRLKKFVGKTLRIPETIDVEVAAVPGVADAKIMNMVSDRTCYRTAWVELTSSNILHLQRLVESEVQLHGGPVMLFENLSDEEGAQPSSGSMDAVDEGPMMVGLVGDEEVPMGELPMGEVPRGEVPMVEVPMGELPMGELPREEGTAPGPPADREGA